MILIFIKIVIVFIVIRIFRFSFSITNWPNRLHETKYYILFTQFIIKFVKNETYYRNYYINKRNYVSLIKILNSNVQEEIIGWCFIYYYYSIVTIVSYKRKSNFNNVKVIYSIFVSLFLASILTYFRIKHHTSINITRKF